MTKSKISSGIIIIFSLIAFFFLLIKSSNLETQSVFEDHSYKEDISYYKGIVTEIEYERIEEDYITQEIKVEITSKERLGEIVSVSQEGILDLDMSHRYKRGDNIILSSIEGEAFYIVDYSRNKGLFLLFILFIVAILYFGRIRGAGAILGLAFSVLVLIYYILPNILSGKSPVLVILIGVLVISGVSVFLAHGISKRTNVVYLSTMVTLIISILLSYFSIEIATLFGRGSDVAFSFQFGQYSDISLKGLFLAGLMIGILGILTDVTATQTAVIWEIKDANPKLTTKELYKKGLLVGREHIASLVNTLVLVYVGASFPLLIIITGADYMPLWVILNSEPIAEEIVRAIIGSISLILAVPISSFFASYFAVRLYEKKENW